ncbi:capsule biosynthesis protein [Poseidonocella sp. HB161398]|uniref:capsule biosynthesis protein n=1 Tax=Poseidonocella sp. HB161398 TaxID=2320855 RepID=UPI001108C972|nr:capsule biosynthesis protein [Poseidonocella sp. HB161398]
MNTPRSAQGGTPSEPEQAGNDETEISPEVISGKPGPAEPADSPRPGPGPGRKPGGPGRQGGPGRPGGPGKPGGRGPGPRAAEAKAAGVPVPVEGNPVPARRPDAPVPARPGQGGGAGGRKPPLNRVSMAPVPRARLRHKHRFLFYTFFLMVLLPAAGAFYYLYEHAQDRYASNSAFFVHKEDTSTSIETVFGLTGIGGTTTTPDADVLYQFIQSQRMVELADQKLDLRAMFSPAYDVDPVFSLKPDATLEDMIDYWGRAVKVIYEADSGLINLEVRAFSPEDAQKISQEILDESATLINDLSRISEGDSIKEAEADLHIAEERLKKSRVAVAEFRGSSQFVDPSASVAGQEGVITALETRLAEEMIARDALVGTTTRDDDPRLERSDRMIEAIRERIKEERANVGSDQAPAVGTYEELLADRQFAEAAYTAALGAYDAAVAEARRKSRYLAVHIEPTLAASSIYPQRVLYGLTATAFLFVIWGVAMLVVMSIRDRR